MKPFLLLQSRPEDEASNNEYEAFLKFTQLETKNLERLRVEDGNLPSIDLGKYSAIIVGGGPYNVSDLKSKKTIKQTTLEAKLDVLLDEIIEKDFPFLGACYGVGLLTANQNGIMSSKYKEDVGPTKISLTKDGEIDPLLKDVPSEFEAFVGHKEACEVLPESATLLASSKKCPIQMFRIKNNVYATQFHPELDSRGLEVRINIYKHAGYFPPEAATDLIASGYAAHVSEPVKILRNFTKLYLGN